MGTIAFLIFLILPVAEIMLLGRVSSFIGIWNTLMLLIFSGAFGGYLAGIQGRAILARVQQSLSEGRPPTAEMLDGLLIFLGGILFVIPGFITDIFGLLFLFPLTRWLFRFILAGLIQGNYAARDRQGTPRQPRTGKGKVDLKHDAQDAEIVE